MYLKGRHMGTLCVSGTNIWILDLVVEMYVLIMCLSVLYLLLPAFAWWSKFVIV